GRLPVPVRAGLRSQRRAAGGAVADAAALRHRHLARGAARHPAGDAARPGAGAAALAGRCLCRAGAEHALPGAAADHLLRPAVHRREADGGAGGDRRDHPQSRRLFDRNRPRRHREHPPEPDRGGAVARHDAVAGLPPCRHRAGAGAGLALALQPVRADDALHLGLLLHLRAGALGDGRQCGERYLPQLRGLHHRYRHLPGAGAGDARAAGRYWGGALPEGLGARAPAGAVRPM
ncbi:MAG: ABC transporter, permease protein (cluster 3, basic aa/glutamine/opines), partial [uncultured Craurococcus sp.]